MKGENMFNMLLLNTIPYTILKHTYLTDYDNESIKSKKTKKVFYKTKT